MGGQRSIDRRTLLKLGFGGTALLAVGGVGLGLRPTVYVPVKGKLTHLNARQYSVFYAMADAVVSPSDEMPSIGDLDVVETIDGMLSELHPDDVSQLLQAVGLPENALTGLLLDGRFHTFTSASRAVRVEILDGWRSSRLSVKQQAYTALHALCVAAYWGNPTAYQFAGYMGPPNFSGLAPSGGGQDG